MTAQDRRREDLSGTPQESSFTSAADETRIDGGGRPIDPIGSTESANFAQTDFSADRQDSTENTTDNDAAAENG